MIDSSQRERELRRLAEGREVLLKTILEAEKKGKVDHLPYHNYLVRQAIELVAADIKADLKGKTGAGAYKKYVRYLGSIDPKIAALRAIQAVLGVLLREGGADVPQPLWKKASYAAGAAIYSEYLMRHFKDISPALFNSLVREYGRSMTSDEKHMLAAFKAKYRNEGYEFPTWDFGDIEQVGAYILTRLVAHKFLESWSRTEHKKGKAYTVRYIVLDPGLWQNALDITEAVSQTARVAGPLIEPPLDWDAETNTGGGFHTPDMQRLAAYAVQGKGVGRVAPRTVGMLNYLQRRAWTVNVPVLEAVREMSTRRDFKDVISPMRVPKPAYDESFDEAQKKRWKKEARKWYTEKKVRTVKHLSAQKVFREAQELARYPAIWFAYYADFRGRAYARSASLSPQGTDLEKGLLTLSKSKPLSSASAVAWFKRHGAGKFGHDKIPFHKREEWVDANDEFLRAMAADPVANDGWTEADAPVQFLAWVLEYGRWRAEPDRFESSLPVSLDGTCNGLQNFSALMCDPIGGAAVNLVPGDAPRDIYSDVAERVVLNLKARPSDPLRDGWLLHGISRKVTKRPTMTLPYGSTRFAASTFIMDYIEDSDTPELTQIDAEDWGDAANYLSYVVWDSLGEVVVKAMEVMKWLQGWAKDAAKRELPVAWIAPSGLHVVSDYEATKKVEAKSVAFKTRIRLLKPTGKPDLKKVVNAVAPNFVHSLDASHMERVVAKAEAEGMMPVTIHDDFGVHAADTERFAAIIREEFVAMYEGNTLLADMQASTGYEIDPPSVGDLDLRQVLRSPYFFH